MALPPDVHASVMSVLKAAFPATSASDLARDASRIVIKEALALSDPTVGRRGTKKALESLNDINKKAVRLWLAIDVIGADEKHILRRMGAPSREDMLRVVSELSRHIMEAQKKIKIEPSIPSRSRGKPADIAAARVQSEAAHIYQQRTGKPATLDERNGRPSPYNKFLQEIFASLKMKSSAKHRVKVARKRINK